MTNRLMMSVAAIALLTGTSFANAQGMNREAPAGAAPAEHAAPSAAPAHAAPSAAPMNRAAPASGAPGMKAESAERPAQPNAAAPAERAQNNAEPNARGNEAARENPVRENTENNTRENRENNNGNRMGEKAEGRDTEKTEGRENNVNRENTNAAESKENRSQTVGQAGAGAKITTEQRTKITSVIREQHVRPIEHVNFSISVGTRVPRETSFHSLPPEIITYYPEWRGYEYFLVNDQIIVVDPRTFEIVAVLEA